MHGLILDQHDPASHTVRKTLDHPGTKGDVGEKAWLALLQTYLPRRDQAATAHVVDSSGIFSQQIDEGQTIIPAESVYAVFEASRRSTRARLLMRKYSDGAAAVN